ncbi:hypothetical protein G9A89_022502 [Geosiphon pyriformis]|nr:hypothetical protein G9A89_022502 [Geosiphon pyriformis]
MSSADSAVVTTTDATTPLRLKSHHQHRSRKSSVSFSKTDLLLETLREEQVFNSQKAARDFIEQTLVSPLSNEDFHKSLQDGVILCSLMNKLKPNIIPQISKKDLPFVKRENISNFLKAARQFGLHNSDLFETVDLFEGKDMDRVVATILAIARIMAGTHNRQESDLSIEQENLKEVGKITRYLDGSISSLSSSGSFGNIDTKNGDQKKARKNIEGLTIKVLGQASNKKNIYLNGTTHKHVDLENQHKNKSSTKPKIHLTNEMEAMEISTTKEKSLDEDKQNDDDEIVINLKNVSCFEKKIPKNLSKIKPINQLDKIDSDSRTILSLSSSFSVNTSSTIMTERTIVESEKTFFQNEELSDSKPNKKESKNKGTNNENIDNNENAQMHHNISIPTGGPLQKKRPSLRKSLTMGQLFNKIGEQEQQESEFSENPSPLPPATPSSTSSTPIIGAQKPKRIPSRKTHIRYKSDRTAEISTNRNVDNQVEGDRISVYGETRKRESTAYSGIAFIGNCESITPKKKLEKLILTDTENGDIQYQLGNCIGKGQFGSVYRALNLSNGQMVAIKRIKLDDKKSEEVEELMREVELLKSLAHPSVVKYHTFIMSDNHINIILEYVENGSLLHTLKSFGNFPEKLVVSYVVKILEGLVYLHFKQVVHCDLKAANILSTKNGNVKLSDFGVSLNLKMMENVVNTNVAGTPNWMAPEVIELKGASTASDIWSLGCTVIELLTGKPPYSDLLSMTALFRIVEDDCPPIPEGISNELRDFLKQCFQKDSNLRPTARDLFRHSWIRKNWTLKELRTQDSLPFLRRITSNNESSEDSNLMQTVVPLDFSNKEFANSSLDISPITPEPSSPIDIEFHPQQSPSQFGTPVVMALVAPPITTTANTTTTKIFAATPMVPHRFVKNSFGKPVECRICHHTVKKHAHICQECNMVCHQKCSPEAPWPCAFSNRQIMYTPIGVIDDNRLNNFSNNPSDHEINTPMISPILANFPISPPQTPTQNKSRQAYNYPFSGKKAKKDDSVNSQSSTVTSESVDSSFSGSSSRFGSPMADNSGRPFSSVSSVSTDEASTKEVTVIGGAINTINKENMNETTLITNNQNNNNNNNQNNNNNGKGSGKSRAQRLIKKKGGSSDQTKFTAKHSFVHIKKIRFQQNPENKKINISK